MEERRRKQLKIIGPIAILCIILMFLPIWPVQTSYERYGVTDVQRSHFSHSNYEKIYTTEYEINMYSMVTIVDRQFYWVVSDYSESSLNYDYELRIERNIFSFAIVGPIFALIGCSMFLSRQSTNSKGTNYKLENNFQR